MKPSHFYLFAVLVLFLASISLAQQDETVYVTKTGAKYHKAGCSYLKKSSISMKLSEAAKSYSPCSRCNPPTLTEKKGTPDEKSKVKKEPSKEDNQQSVGTTPTGKTIYEGPRGGKYHYSKSGKKVYERKKK